MAIVNTAEQEERREWLLGGNPSAIERQEARGQEQICSGSQLPTEGLLEVAGKFGIEVIGVSEGDSLFSDVRLPDGWKIVPTDHSMWSKLVDENGVEKARIFYKAAFYDRSAFIRA